MSTVVKVAAIAAFFRLFVMAFGMISPVFKDIVLLLGVLSVVFGNLLAVGQSNVKRMLAYSGISHAGFMFLAISVVNKQTTNATLYYMASYALSGIALFWVVIEMNKLKLATISDYKGLIQRNGLLTFTLVLSMLSMAGIPPLAGFIAKYNVLIQIFSVKNISIALLAIFGSLVAVYYYFKLIISSVQNSDTEINPEKIQLSILSKIFLILLNLSIILLGVFSNIIIKYT
jgi:NADH-quinone oxidoreductase subunit N